ncbi:hypothetical protein N431DRAFT_431433 [Stipitochalara longipes BDJ]|nr:hypothetical protein N431DRAFT_431433 [Stipitochalara longipes BDJ]
MDIVCLLSRRQTRRWLLCLLQILLRSRSAAFPTFHTPRLRIEIRLVVDAFVGKVVGFVGYNIPALYGGEASQLTLTATRPVSRPEAPKRVRDEGCVLGPINLRR